MWHLWRNVWGNTPTSELSYRWGSRPWLMSPSVMFITIWKIMDWKKQIRTFMQTTAPDKIITITSGGILPGGPWRFFSFLIAGHTKFGPDRCFGLIKKSYKVSSLYEFTTLVDTSSAVGINKVQIVGTHDGRVIVPVYDWVSFLGQYFKKLPNIKKFHYFTFSKESLGIVSYKESVYSPQQSFMLLRNPAVIPHAAL